MSRRSRRAQRKQRAQRGYLHSTANEVAVRSNVLALEDRRLWAPLEETPRGLFHRSSRLVVTPYPNVNKSRAAVSPPAGVSFAVPREVAVCVRRKQRREVLFAKRRTGKGARARRRRNAWSDISC